MAVSHENFHLTLISIHMYQFQTKSHAGLKKVAKPFFIFCFLIWGLYSVAAFSSTDLRGASRNEHQSSVSHGDCDQAVPLRNFLSEDDLYDLPLIYNTEVSNASCFQQFDLRASSGGLGIILVKPVRNQPPASCPQLTFSHTEIESLISWYADVAIANSGANLPSRYGYGRVTLDELFLCKNEFLIKTKFLMVKIPILNSPVRLLNGVSPGEVRISVPTVCLSNLEVAVEGAIITLRTKGCRD